MNEIYFETCANELHQIAAQRLSAADAGSVMAWFHQRIENIDAKNETEFREAAIHAVTIQSMLVEFYADFYRNNQKLIYEAINRVFQKSYRTADRDFCKVYDSKNDLLSVPCIATQECAAEAWIAIFNNLAKFDPDGGAKFSTFCFQIATNTAKNYLKARRRKLNPQKRGRLKKNGSRETRWFVEVPLASETAFMDAKEYETEEKYEELRIIA